LVSLFADQAALAIEKARLYAEVQRLATVDEVTGLLNRRGLWEFGRREFERSRRFSRPLAVIFLDIDHFKQVNDTYGHAIGDQVLRTLCDRLRANTREVDVVARYGGEEFVILLPEVETPLATQVAERLRRSMAEAPAVTDQGPVKVSISLGVVQMRNEIHDLATLIDLADQAMFAAKQNGRNRVEVLQEALDHKR
jgi:diguanylate cyclase (GGDEF)-like protein